MSVAITERRWDAVRTSLATTGERFADLSDAAAAPSARATAHWSAAETVAHVVTLAELCHAMVESDPTAGTAGLSDGLGDLVHTTVIDGVADFNDTMLGRLTERDTRVLAARLRERVDGILTATEGADPAAGLPWLGGSRLPLAGLLAHLLNELQIHGRDVARAARASWRTAPEEAALFFDLFLVGVIDYGYGRLLEGHGPAPKGRIAVEFRSVHTTPKTIALTDGAVAVEEPGPDADVRVSFDPVTLNLLLFHRVSPARALLARKVSIGGRRPWTLPAFLRVMRLP